jgi:hypothetical protein
MQGLWHNGCSVVFVFERPFLAVFFKGRFLEIHVESFSWKWARTSVSVVVDRGRGSTTTNYEGLMMRTSCNTKRVNIMVRTCWK